LQVHLRLQVGKGQERTAAVFVTTVVGVTQRSLLFHSYQSRFFSHKRKTCLCANEFGAPCCCLAVYVRYGTSVGLVFEAGQHVSMDRDLQVEQGNAQKDQKIAEHLARDYNVPYLICSTSGLVTHKTNRATSVLRTIDNRIDLLLQ